LIQKALSVNPSSLDGHSLLAALAYVEDKTPEFEAEVAKVLGMSRGHAEVYRVAAEYTAHAYRFDEAVALVRRALDIAPRHQQALADLGMYLLRTGDEGGARNALESSFKLNPYDVVTYNLLEMMDTLDKFITTEQGDVVLRIDKADAAVLQAPALPVVPGTVEAVSEHVALLVPRLELVTRQARACAGRLAAVLTAVAGPDDAEPQDQPSQATTPSRET